MSKGSFNGNSQNSSEDLMKALITTEQQKISLQKEKLAHDAANQERQFKYACQVLEAKKEILKDNPAQLRKNYWTVASIVIIVLIIILGFFMFCIHKGKEAIVYEIVKIFGTALLSFGGGFYYGKSKAVNKVEDDQVVE